MHRICYGFYRSIMNWSKLGQKTDFWAHFVSHFVLQNNVSPRSQKSQFFVKLSKKQKGGPQIEPKLSPMGLCQRVIRNSYIAYNRTFYLYFLDAKFQLLGICSSQLYPEETTIFGSWHCWAQFGGFGAITPVNNIRLSWNFDHKEFS